MLSTTELLKTKFFQITVVAALFLALGLWWGTSKDTEPAPVPRPSIELLDQLRGEDMIEVFVTETPRERRPDENGFVWFFTAYIPSLTWSGAISFDEFIQWWEVSLFAATTLMILLGTCFWTLVISLPLTWIQAKYQTNVESTKYVYMLIGFSGFAAMNFQVLILPIGGPFVLIELLVGALVINWWSKRQVVKPSKESG